MVSVILYAILIEDLVIEKWVDSNKKQRLSKYAEQVYAKVKHQPSILIRTIKQDGLSAYYFMQDSFFFLIVAHNAERPQHMHNYLRVVADIFYEAYDQRKFPTVLARIMGQINRIEGSEPGEQQHEGLMGLSLKNQKRRLGQMLEKKQRSTLAYKVSACLFFWIVVLALYYLWRYSQRG